MIAAVVAAGSLAASGWTAAHARHVLATADFMVADSTQPDAPAYDLTFTRAQARALRPARGRHRRFVFAGTAYDGYTDRDLPVRFELTARGALVGFRGPPADTSEPAFPIRAAFYYAWYPEAWTRASIFPYSVFHPSLSWYATDDAPVVRRQVDALLYAHLNAAVYSWWGVDGYPPTDERFWRYLAASRMTPLRWAIYYEREGYANPTVDQIRSDLEYVRDRYGSLPAYLRVGGRFVVFVYGGPGDGCATVARWRQANEGIGAYVVLKAFAGYSACAAQPDAWHQYSGSSAEYELPGSAFMISPGFDEVREGTPRLPRAIDRWRQDVADMVAAHDPWQLVISFNEWPEGTSVESAREWATTSGYGAYLDALHDGIP